MTAKHLAYVQRTTLTLGLLLLASAASLQAQTVLFSDTFNRPNHLNISADATGMSGPAAPMTYKETDLLPTPNNDALTQITNNMLGLATGPNASAVGLQSHNFIDSEILSDGGFRVSMKMQKLASTQTATDNYCGFGVGISATEMAALTLDNNLNTGPRGNFGSGFTGVADFYTCWTLNGGGDVQIFFQSVSTGTQFDVNVGTTAGVVHTLRADFYPAGFGAGDNVIVHVFIDNALVVKTNFTWTEANANYLAVSARLDSGFLVDDLLVETISLADAQLVWQGDGGANEWNTTDLNWKHSVLDASTAFADGKNVTFDDTSVNPAVTVSGTVSPAAMTVSSVNDYSFSGGEIAGGGALSKLGAGTLTLSQSNSFSGGATLNGGRVRAGHNHALGSGLLTLSSGAISSDSATARTLPNPARITIATTVGDATDNGRLTLNGPVEFGGAGRTLTVNSDVVFAGGATNGRVGIKQGPGTLTVKGTVEFNGASDVVNGTLIFDDATVTNSDRLVPDAGAAGGTARLVITNGASVTIGNATSNLRAGRVASPGTNIVDLAGRYSIPNADTASGNAGFQANAAYSEMTIWPGGDFTARGVTLSGATTGITVFNFNGGILRARNDNTDFFAPLTQILVQAGGANFDDGGFTVAINQPLLAGGGSGGLNKIGNGTLLLNANNTYTGLTVVSNGTFGGSGVLSGPLLIKSGATLVPGNSMGTITINGAVTLEGSVAVELGSATADFINAGVNPIALGGVLTVADTSGGNLVPGTVFNLLDGTLTGAFTTINLPGNPAHWNTTELVAGGNGTLTFINNAPVAQDFELGVAAGGATNQAVVGVFGTDADAGDVVTITAVSTPANGTLQIVGGTNLLYTATESAAGDSFTYTVSDGLSSATGTVTVQIFSPEGFNRLSVDGGVMNYLGIPNASYALEHTESLSSPINWIAVITNTAAGTGTLSFTNIGPGFYRTRHLP